MVVFFCFVFFGRRESFEVWFLDYVVCCWCCRCRKVRSCDMMNDFWCYVC